MKTIATLDTKRFIQFCSQGKVEDVKSIVEKHSYDIYSLDSKSSVSGFCYALANGHYNVCDYLISVSPQARIREISYNYFGEHLVKVKKSSVSNVILIKNYIEKTIGTGQFIKNTDKSSFINVVQKRFCEFGYYEKLLELYDLLGYDDEFLNYLDTEMQKQNISDNKKQFFRTLNLRNLYDDIK